MKNSFQNSILRTENLSIGYQTKADYLLIADNLNFTIQQGEFIAILGKNGAGKSTLLRTLSTMQEILKGKIYLKGKEIRELSNYEIAQEMALVFNERIPQNLLKVYELIRLGRQIHTNWIDKLNQEDLKYIELALEITNTKELQSKFFDQLSDGQKQKVLIARAVAQDTPLLLLDEPTAHLDIHHRMESFLFLKKLAHEHQKSIIIATHEIGLTCDLADTIWLFDDTKIMVGTPKELITNGQISKVFDSDLIHFNPIKGNFEYK